jgi:hypothetical protein
VCAAHKSAFTVHFWQSALSCLHPMPRVRVETAGAQVIETTATACCSPHVALYHTLPRQPAPWLLRACNVGPDMWVQPQASTQLGEHVRTSLCCCSTFILVALLLGCLSSMLTHVTDGRVSGRIVTALTSMLPYHGGHNRGWNLSQQYAAY